MTYYNTNNCSGQLVLEFTSKNQSQEERVLELFYEVKRPLSWCEVKGFLDFNECSIKRCLSDLKEKGKLIKEQTTVTGSFGKPVHRYKLI